MRYMFFKFDTTIRSGQRAVIHGALPRSLDPHPSSEYQGPTVPEVALLSSSHQQRKSPSKWIASSCGGVNLSVSASHFLSFFRPLRLQGKAATNLPRLSRSHEATKMGRIYRWPCFPDGCSDTHCLT
jgi:hypothetical protein